MKSFTVGDRGGSAGRGRPPKAAARRAGLDPVWKVLTNRDKSVCVISGDAWQRSLT
jgi:hypothetical protein